ncbi:MAG: hypothetical protein ACLGH3_07090 [Actinomycetota bacterium]
MPGLEVRPGDELELPRDPEPLREGVDPREDPPEDPPGSLGGLGAVDVWVDFGLEPPPPPPGGGGGGGAGVLVGWGELVRVGVGEGEPPPPPPTGGISTWAAPGDASSRADPASRVVNVPRRWPFRIT